MNRKDEYIIVEYPFSFRWKKVFKDLSDKYSYDIYTINSRIRNFDKIWDRIVTRDLSDNRHISHKLMSYNPLYDEKHLKINLGTVVDFYNEDEGSIEEIFNEIVR